MTYQRHYLCQIELYNVVDRLITFSMIDFERSGIGLGYLEKRHFVIVEND
jgi:hypothetical protein